MSKNLNMVRTRDWGRKEIYFENTVDLARFISLYRDLFYPGAETNRWNGETYYWTQFMDTDRFKYKLGFMMKYDEWRRIESSLKPMIKRRKLIFNKGRILEYEKGCRCFINEAV